MLYIKYCCHIIYLCYNGVLSVSLLTFDRLGGLCNGWGWGWGWVQGTDNN